MREVQASEAKTHLPWLALPLASLDKKPRQAAEASGVELLGMAI